MVPVMFFFIWLTFFCIGIFIAVLLIKVLLKVLDVLDIYIMKNNKDGEGFGR